MILQALKDLAEQEGLTQDLDYEPKPVRWVVSLDKSGQYVGLTCTDFPQGARQKLLPKMMRIPRRSGRTSGDQADFLVDKPEYAVGLSSQAEPTAKEARRLENRRGLFLSAVRNAAAAVQSVGLNALAAFLQSDTERAACVRELVGAACDANDLICFEMEGSLLHEEPATRRYFGDSRNAAGTQAVQCLVCGAMRPSVEKHPAVQVRGGSSSGIALVSFNADAFESYGWQRNANAAVCRSCAESYTTALRRLLSDRYPDPNNDGATLRRRFVGLTDDTVAVVWADQPSASVDLFAELFEQPSAEAAKEFLEGPWKGRSTSTAPATVYCLFVSGAQGRATVRGIHTRAISEVEASVLSYFRVLETYSHTPIPLFALLRSLAVLGKPRNLPPGLATETFSAILFGGRFPRIVLSSAILRCRSEQSVPRERAIAIHLYLNRLPEYEDITMGLDRQSTQSGYRLGRLLAVLERLQTSANPSLKKTIVDRYYGAASTRPVTVFPSLIHLAQHHTGKTPSAAFFQREIGEVLDGLQLFPAGLTMEEQGLFALGYYHQRQQYFKKREGEASDDVVEAGNPEVEA